MDNNIDCSGCHSRISKGLPPVPLPAAMGCLLMPRLNSFVSNAKNIGLYMHHLWSDFENEDLTEEYLKMDFKYLY